MDYSYSFSISAAGMSLEKTRVEVAALNLANANTTQAADGGIFKPMRVVAEAAAGAQAFGQLVASGRSQQLTFALPKVSVESVQVEPRMVHEPGHPLANAGGFVAYANVDPTVEMMTFMQATRAYEANVAAMNTARSLALRALEIGGNT